MIVLIIQGWVQFINYIMDSLRLQNQFICAIEEYENILKEGMEGGADTRSFILDWTCIF